MSIKNKLKNKNKEKFVGRENEINRFKSIISNCPPDFNIYSIIGVGGIGKSTLLSTLFEISYYEFKPCVMVNCTTNTSSIDLMKEIVKGLEATNFKKFEKVLSKYYEIETKITSLLTRTNDGLVDGIGNVSISGIPVGAAITGMLGKDRIKSFVNKHISPQDMDNYFNAMHAISDAFVEGLNLIAAEQLLVIFFDTYEDASIDVDEWVRSLITKDLSENTLMVIAGRDSLENKNEYWNEYKDIIFEKTLDKLSREDAVKYISTFHIENVNLINAIIKLSEGLPLALELTVESLSQEEISNNDLDIVSSANFVGQKLITRFLRQISGNDDLYRSVRALSVFPSFNEDILISVVNIAVESKASIKALSKYSFLRVLKDGQYYIHDIVREFLEKEYCTNSRVSWQKTKLLAFEYFERKSENLTKHSTDYYKCKIESFRHLIAIDEEKAIKFLIQISENVFGPVLYDLIYAPLINIAKDRKLSKKNESILKFFEAQLYVLRGENEPAIRLLEEIDLALYTEDEIKLLTLIKLYDLLHRTGQFDRAFDVANRGLSVSLLTEKTIFAAMFAARVCQIYNAYGNINSADEYYSRTLGFLAPLDESFYTGEVYLLVAHIYLYRNDYEKGEHNLKMALNAWKIIRYEFGIAQVNSSLSWLSSMTGKWETAKMYGMKAYDHFLAIEDDYYIGLAALNIAKPFYHQKNCAEAIKWNEIASQKMKKISTLYYAIALKQLGMCYYLSNDNETAIQYLERSKGKEEEVNERFTYGSILLNLSLAYKKTGMEEAANEAIKLSELELQHAQNDHAILQLICTKTAIFLDEGKLAEANSCLESAVSNPALEKFKDIGAWIEFLQFKYHILLTVKQDEPFDLRSIGHIQRALLKSLEFNVILLYDIFGYLEEFIKQNEPSISSNDQLIITSSLLDLWQTGSQSTLSYHDQELQNRSVELVHAARTPVLRDRIKEWVNRMQS